MAKDRIESKYVTVAPGVELHILEKGKGKPLVFIPGLTFSGEIFKNQLEYFSSEYRVIAIDPRGQGYSAKTVDGNDYLTHGRDVAGLIDALGLKDIVLIGWSTGNLDTWSYVQQFGKDKLRGVVLSICLRSRSPLTRSGGLRARLKSCLRSPLRCLLLRRDAVSSSASMRPVS